MEKIKIGNSDYSREEIENGNQWTWGISNDEFLYLIRAFESEGYVIEFKTSFLRSIFGIGKYKVIATK